MTMISIVEGVRKEINKSFKAGDAEFKLASH
jgi:hypothetical protein